MQGITEAKVSGKIPKEGPITEGHRNVYLTRMAGSIRHVVTREDGREILMGINNSKCSPPLDFEEVMKIAGSVARYGYRKEPHAAIPISYLDAMSRLQVSPSAHRVLLAIIRKTVGWTEPL